MKWIPITILLGASTFWFGAGWFLAKRGQEANRIEITPGVRKASKDVEKPFSALAQSSLQEVMGRINNGSLEDRAHAIGYAASLSVSEVKAALKETDKRWPSNKWVFDQILLERWAELDVDGLLEEARTSSSDRLRSQGVKTAFKYLANKDPDHAWVRADELSPRMSQYAHSGIIAQLGINDPERAFEFALRLDTSDVFTTAGLMMDWAATDPTSAATAALRLPTGEARNRSLSMIAKNWATQNIDAALEWSRGLEFPGERRIAVNEVLCHLAETDPEKAMLLVENGNGEHREAVTLTVAKQLAGRDFDAALEFAVKQPSFSMRSRLLSSLSLDVTTEQAEKLMDVAKALPSNLAKEIYESSVWTVAYKDPERLNGWIEQIPQASIRESVMLRVIDEIGDQLPTAIARGLFEQLQPTSQRPGLAAGIAWNLAKENPQEAAAWAESFENVALRNAALSSAVKAWAYRNPENAKDYVANIEDGEVRQDITRTLAELFANRDMEGAEQWAESLKGSDRSAALASIVEIAASRDPESVPDLYSTFADRDSLSPDDAARSKNYEIAESIANQMAKNDSANALSWLSNLPAGPARDAAMGGIASAWATYDPYATSEWLYQQPASPGRDLAAQELINIIALDDPERAWAWATVIDEPARRRESAETVIEAWKAHGMRNEAAAALGNSDQFSDSELSELGKKLE